jgi:peptidoglycan hydrolase CwlO-like protein
MSLYISERAYFQMLKDQGIEVLSRQREELKDENTRLEAIIKRNQWKITGLTSTIAALHLCKEN